MQIPPRTHLTTQHDKLEHEPARPEQTAPPQDTVSYRQPHTRGKVSAGGPTRATPGDKHPDVIQRSKLVRANGEASPVAPALAGFTHYVPRACSPVRRPPVRAPRHPRGTAPVWAASGTPSSVGVKSIKAPAASTKARCSGWFNRNLHRRAWILRPPRWKPVTLRNL